MPKTSYQISLKGYVGGYDFDRATVDKELAKNEGKQVNVLIDSLCGSLATGDWYIVTSPSSTKSLCFAKNRRHKERNFASLISARLGSLLGIPFYEDLAECHSLS
ncbi:MAG: hypothetical protein K2L59_08875 [Muribaculaceae bacterium]|nr:hypothetical protein [Muribaculaceae bacterium]